MKPAGSVRSRRWGAEPAVKETSGIMQRMIARRTAMMVAPAYRSMTLIMLPAQCRSQMDARGGYWH
jgi:hypothetical protein